MSPKQNSNIRYAGISNACVKILCGCDLYITAENEGYKDNDTLAPLCYVLLVDGSYNIFMEKILFFFHGENIVFFFHGENIVFKYR